MERDILFWLLVLVLLFAVAGVFAFALRRPKAAGAPDTAAHEEITLLKNELRRLDTEVAAGRLLLRLQGQLVGETANTAAPRRARSLAALVAALVLLPVVSVSVYLINGRPDFVRITASERLAAVREQQQSINEQQKNEEAAISGLLAQVEKRQAETPDDVRGWKLLVPIYARLGRLDKARGALDEVIRLEGATATSLANLGELEVMAENGLVTPAAETLFQRALQLDPKHVKARIFTALILRQKGETQGALEIWQGLVSETENLEKKPSWLTLAHKNIAELTREEGAPTSPAFSADQAQMIETMVAGLARRLDAEGGSPEEWQRLVRSYSILGRPAEARAALGKAKTALKDNPEELQALLAFADTLKLDDKDEGARP